MALIERTIYPRFSKVISKNELLNYSPTKVGGFKV